MYLNAIHPEDIYVGLYQQNEPEDPNCVEPLYKLCEDMEKNLIPANNTIKEKLCNNLKKIQINRTDTAQIPVLGKFMSFKMYDNQEYVCVIDSHMKFRKDWDSVTLTLFEGIGNAYSVLTHYPWSAKAIENRTNPEQSYHICGSTFVESTNSPPRNSNGCFVKTDMKNIQNNTAIRVPFFAAGFSFAKAQFWKDVPLDPYLTYIFNGEEFDIAVRGWTSGYDFYSPPFDILGHYYGAEGPKRRPPNVGDSPYIMKRRDKSEKRINYKWGVLKNRTPQATWDDVDIREISKYGMGNKRTLDQYWRFAGINILNKTATVFSTGYYSKGGLSYVPWNNVDP